MNINVSILRYLGEERFNAVIKKVLFYTLGTILSSIDQRTTIYANKDILNVTTKSILKRTLEEILKSIINGSLNVTVKKTFNFANDV
jgi:hypothetical protein